MYDLRVVVLVTANYDGSQTSQLTNDQIAEGIMLANPIYNPQNINFIFDHETDIYRFNDDTLNRDCSRRDNVVYRDKNTDPAALPETNAAFYNDRRNEVAKRYPGRIVAYITSGNRYRWDDSEQRWIYGPRDYSWSNNTDQFVTLAASEPQIAHEVGHYLGLSHTHGYWPEAKPNLADIKQEIADFIRSKVEAGEIDRALAINLFDGDDIADTPPDPSPQISAPEGKTASPSREVGPSTRLCRNRFLLPHLDGLPRSIRPRTGGPTCCCRCVRDGRGRKVAIAFLP